MNWYDAYHQIQSLNDDQLHAFLDNANTADYLSFTNLLQILELVLLFCKDLDTAKSSIIFTFLCNWCKFKNHQQHILSILSSASFTTRNVKFWKQISDDTNWPPLLRVWVANAKA